MHRASRGQAPQSAKASPSATGKATAPAGQADGPWTPLFNGRDLDGWYTFLQKHGKNSDPDRVITIEDGTIHLYKHAANGSHVVMGYIGTEKEYGNYHLRLQYRWGAKKFEPRYKLKRDAGLYYHILGPDAVWPRSLQFQIEQTNVGDLIALYGMTADTWIDPKTRGADIPTFQSPAKGGEPRVMGGRHRLSAARGWRFRNRRLEHNRSCRERKYCNTYSKWLRGERGPERAADRPGETGGPQPVTRDESRLRSRRPKSTSGRWNYAN